jgi:hypothetical protein
MMKPAVIAADAEPDGVAVAAELPEAGVADGLELAPDFELEHAESARAAAATTPTAPTTVGRLNRESMRVQSLVDDKLLMRTDKNQNATNNGCTDKEPQLDAHD